MDPYVICVLEQAKLYSQWCAIVGMSVLARARNSINEDGRVVLPSGCDLTRHAGLESPPSIAHYLPSLLSKFLFLAILGTAGRVMAH